MARRRATIAVVALVAMLTSPIPGVEDSVAEATPTTTSEPPDPGTNPDLRIGVEPLEAKLPDVTFPDTLINATSVKGVELSNDGTTQVLVTGTMVSGNGFELSPDGNACQDTVLEPNESCTIDVMFSPTSPGDFDGVLTATAGGELVTSRLTGTGIDESITVPPATSPPATSPESTPPPTTEPTAPDTASPPSSDQAPPTTDSIPPTSTPPTDIDDLAERTRECERQVKQVIVSYPAELEMTVGRESEVAVSVTLEGSPAPTGDPSAPGTVDDAATLTCFVTATLSGTNFEIDDPTRPGDFVINPSITWTWDVTPKATGRHDLDLRITPRIGSGPDATDGTPREFRADITVTAEPRSAWQVLSDLVSDISQHSFFQFAVAAGFVSAIGAAIRRRANAVVARRREQQASDDNQHDGYL